jgi:hypothetical protein
MRPRPRAATRLLPTGLALLAALVLSACGGSGSSSETTATGEARVIPAPQSGAATAPDPRCGHQLGGFLDSLDSLRHQLAVGLSYHPYAARVRSLKKAYKELPVEYLSIDCLLAAGTPSEKALNRYIEAANTWGECLSTPGCTSVSIESKLQQQWGVASHFLNKAQAGLRRE